MTWYSPADTKDKIFAALVYSLPLIGVAGYGIFLFQEFPFLSYIYVPLAPLMAIYSSIPFAGFIIFLLLFLAVVRNLNISRFIRFNAMQSILMSILLSLCDLVVSVFVSGGMTDNLLIKTLFNIIFLAIWTGCIYAIAQSLMGRYAELPAISNTANSQTP